MAIQLDTLAYARRLENAGFTRGQAEARAEGLAEVVDRNLATKHDIALLKKDTALLQKDIESLRSDIRADMEKMKRELTMTIIGAASGAVAFLAAIKFFG